MYPVLRPSPGAPDHFRPDAPAALVDAASAFVASAAFQFAKTMPTVPHWYTLRRVAEAQGTADGYDALRELIISHHYLRSWRGRSFRSVTLGGYSLWIMQTGLVLVNAKPAEPGDWHSEEPGLFEFLED